MEAKRKQALRKGLKQSPCLRCQFELEIQGKQQNKQPPGRVEQVARGRTCKIKDLQGIAFGKPRNERKSANQCRQRLSALCVQGGVAQLEVCPRASRFSEGMPKTTLSACGPLLHEQQSRSPSKQAFLGMS